jgi:peptidoglycan hydrolase CwlO-like protein
MTLEMNGAGGKRFFTVIAVVAAIVSPIVSVEWVAADFRVENEHRMTLVEKGQDDLAGRIQDLKVTLGGQLQDQHSATEQQIQDLKSSISALWQQVGHANGLLMQQEKRP